MGKKGDVVWNCRYCTEYFGCGVRRASRKRDEVANREIETASSRGMMVAERRRGGVAA